MAYPLLTDADALEAQGIFLMKLSIRDLIKIAVVAVLSFPLTYLVVLFATGNARLEFSKGYNPAREMERLRTVTHSKRRDSLAVVHMESYQALQRERKELEEMRSALEEREQRIEMVRRELEQSRAALAEERKKFETGAQEDNEASQKRAKQLARVYGAMRPEEAARILETLEMSLVVEILSNINDDRQRAKILAALPQDRAGSVSRRLRSGQSMTLGPPKGCVR